MQLGKGECQPDPAIRSFVVPPFWGCVEAIGFWGCVEAIGLLPLVPGGWPDSKDNARPPHFFLFL